MTSKELKEKLAVRLKEADKHRSDLCSYLNTPSRLKDEEICRRVDKLILEYKNVGHLEGKIEMLEIKERKERIH